MCLAVPGKIVAVDDGDPLTRKATVSFGGLEKEVSLTLVPDAIEGDYLLVHAGIAIGRIDEAQAAASLQAVSDMQTAARTQGHG